MRRTDGSHDSDAKMAVVLKELARLLCDYLGGILPKLKPDAWRQDLVVPNLSCQQSERIRQARCSDLVSLDLAALLRVLDKNWWNISNRQSLPHECLHYIKELQSVRNRWAHTGVAPTLADIAYRDLDTIQRLIQALAPEHRLTSLCSQSTMPHFDVSRHRLRVCLGANACETTRTPLPQ
jgi:hypothetical protein